ncbi:MAG: hypothetical protein WCL54_05650 [Clostridia bacterium]
MTKQRIFCDKHEVTLLYDGNQKEESMTLLASEIARIQFDKVIERKFLFLKVESERIEIKPSKLNYSIIYSKSKAKERFEQYKTDLEKFAKDNRVTFVNNLGGTIS